MLGECVGVDGLYAVGAALVGRFDLGGVEADDVRVLSGGQVGFFDPFVLIDERRITLDEPVHVPRQRESGSPEFAAAEKRILDRVLASHSESRKRHKLNQTYTLHSNPTGAK